MHIRYKNAQSRLQLSEQILLPLHTCRSSADRLFDRLPAQLLLVGSSEGIKAALFTEPPSAPPPTSSVTSSVIWLRACCRSTPEEWKVLDGLNLGVYTHETTTYVRNKDNSRLTRRVMSKTSCTGGKSQKQPTLSRENKVINKTQKNNWLTHVEPKNKCLQV